MSNLRLRNVIYLICIFSFLLSLIIFTKWNATRYIKSSLHVNLMRQSSPEPKIFKVLGPHWLCTCTDTRYLEQQQICMSSLDKLGLVNHPSLINGEMAPCILRSS